MKLLSRLVQGRNLSRREHNLLVRVLADLGRVIPLSFFVLIPFMEFALPFALRRARVRVRVRVRVSSGEGHR